MACTACKFKLPWGEAGPPNHLDNRLDSDQWVVNLLCTLCVRRRVCTACTWARSPRTRAPTTTRSETRSSGPCATTSAWSHLALAMPSSRPYHDCITTVSRLHHDRVTPVSRPWFVCTRKLYLCTLLAPVSHDPSASRSVNQAFKNVRTGSAPSGTPAGAARVPICENIYRIYLKLLTHITPRVSLCS